MCIRDRHTAISLAAGEDSLLPRPIVRRSLMTVMIVLTLVKLWSLELPMRVWPAGVTVAADGATVRGLG